MQASRDLLLFYGSPRGPEYRFDCFERVDGAVWTLRGGKCVRLDYYGNKEEALEAAGLSE